MSNLDNLVKAVMDGDATTAVQAAQVVVDDAVPVGTVIAALTDGMREIGEQFARMDIFLPEMMTAAQAMKAVLKALEPAMKEQAAEIQAKGVVVIATVEGDMHEIGKDIVINMLEVHGFEVHDMGFNVNALDIVNEAVKVNADIIGASALMTTTMPQQKDVVEILGEKGLRDRFHVILGGAPVTSEWIEEAGADSWGENAAVAIEVLESVMEEKKNDV
jgi:corrinoid protein of di/trimethylamine methyltransferase